MTAEGESVGPRRLAELVEEIIRFPKPVVCAARGAAAGAGASLVLACALAIFAEDAYLAFVFSSVALMPDAGATALVAASIGRHRSLAIGLVDGPARALARAKWGVNTATLRTFHEVLNREVRWQREPLESRDHAEVRSAFRE